MQSEVQSSLEKALENQMLLTPLSFSRLFSFSEKKWAFNMGHNDDKSPNNRLVDKIFF